MGLLDKLKYIFTHPVTFCKDIFQLIMYQDCNPIIKFSRSYVIARELCDDIVTKMGVFPESHLESIRNASVVAQRLHGNYNLHPNIDSIISATLAEDKIFSHIVEEDNRFPRNIIADTAYVAGMITWAAFVNRGAKP